MIFITQQHIQSESINEIDLTLYDAFGAEDFENGTIIEMGQGSADGEPILIDAVVAILEKLKSAGCNYVGLDYHGDHHGYDFSGYHIRIAEPQEVEVYEHSKAARLAREAEITELYRQIQRLKPNPL